jgi:DNA-3-methyladenine glycosylase I
VAAMLDDPGVIRHRGKIESAINNAGRALELIDEHGSLAQYVWGYAPARRRAPASFSDLPAITDESTALSKDLKKRGWSFVGPTTVYAFMQAMGLVNDHLEGCFVRDECEEARKPVLERYSA